MPRPRLAKSKARRFNVVVTSDTYTSGARRISVWPYLCARRARHNGELCTSTWWPNVKQPARCGLGTHGVRQSTVVVGPAACQQWGPTRLSANACTPPLLHCGCATYTQERNKAYARVALRQRGAQAVDNRFSEHRRQAGQCPLERSHGRLPLAFFVGGMKQAHQGRLAQAGVPMRHQAAPDAVDALRVLGQPPAEHVPGQPRQRV